MNSCEATNTVTKPPNIGINVRLASSIGETLATAAQAIITPETGEAERINPEASCMGIATAAIGAPT